jgi:hypothetical protein
MSQGVTPSEPVKQSRFAERAHALYVILIAFGIERLVEGAYAIWLHPQTSVEKHFANVLVLFAVVLWGARLFWSGTNIERYGERTDISVSTKTTRIVAMHFPLLLGQSAVFFWVCESYRVTVVPLLNGPSSPEGAAAGQFALLVIVSLVYNALWLIALVWPVAPRGCPEIRWIGNNVLFAALIGLAAVALPQIAVPDVSYAILIYGGLLLMNSVTDFRMTGRIYLES